VSDETEILIGQCVPYEVCERCGAVAHKAEKGRNASNCCSFSRP
jgi:hypothetical protein